MPTTELPLLTEDLIRALTDSRSFSRGQDYARSDAVVNPRSQGTMLKAECWGSADEPYRVEVALSEAGIGDGICSCPVSLRCKHAVAVLLTWLHHPERFRKEEDLQAALSRRSQEELVRIILRIIDRCPDAAAIATLPLPGESAGRSAADGDAIRRQVRNIIAHTPVKWGASYAAAAKVGDLLRPGHEYATAGDWANAAVVYAAVADTILEDYSQIYEEEGEYLAVVGECADGLTDCLSHAKNPDQRRFLLETLFGIWRWDIHIGGAGIGEGAEVAMIDDTTADNRHLPPTLMRLAFKCLGPDRLCAVSDASSGAGLPEGARYRMGEMEYEVHDGVGMLLDRSAFAGSTTLLNRMVPVLRGVAGIPLAEAVRMVTLTPARIIGVHDRKGSIAPGKDADLAVFDDDFTTWRVMIDGRWLNALL